MLKVLITLMTVCVTAQLTQSTAFRNCGSNGVNLSNVEVIPCNAEPCPLKRGTNISVDVSFTAKQDIQSAKHKLYGVIGFIPVNFPLPVSDACQYMNMACPISKGQDVTYTLVIPVLPSYPLMRLVVRWELHDETDKLIACFVTPAEITD